MSAAAPRYADTPTPSSTEAVAMNMSTEVTPNAYVHSATGVAPAAVDCQLKTSASHNETDQLTPS